jgi:hypothetical protein
LPRVGPPAAPSHRTIHLLSCSAPRARTSHRAAECDRPRAAQPPDHCAPLASASLSPRTAPPPNCPSRWPTCSWIHAPTARLHTPTAVTGNSRS